MISQGRVAIISKKKDLIKLIDTRAYDNIVCLAITPEYAQKFKSIPNSSVFHSEQEVQFDQSKNNLFIVEDCRIPNQRNVIGLYQYLDDTVNMNSFDCLVFWKTLSARHIEKVARFTSAPVETLLDLIRDQNTIVYCFRDRIEFGAELA